MRKAGIPIVPGSQSAVKDKEEALKTAKKISYPIIIKAAAGGGGKGMRVCHNDISLISGLMTAKSEAEASFGNPSVYIEKYVEKPRHIEIQLLADKYGRVIHLGERDCSIQRRHQKLLEESPSPAVDSKLRKKLGETAVKAAKEVKYSSAGTIEFLMDEKKNFYFMEMNTRIQVEHPVTELVTGIDIVKEQIKLAYGEKLKIQQDDVKINGSSIECRINAENYQNNFMPSPGRIEVLNLPGGPGVRIDSHAYQGYTVSQYYDSLIAKLIVWGRDRKEAIQVMRRSLDEFTIEPIKTTISFHREVLKNPFFVKGEFSTNFINEHFKTSP